MKLNLYTLIRRETTKEFKKHIPIIVRSRKFNKIERSFKRLQLLRILELKKVSEQKSKEKFIKNFMNSSIYKIILLQLSSIKNFKKLNKKQQDVLFIKTFLKIITYFNENPIKASNLIEKAQYQSAYLKSYVQVFPGQNAE
jgi:hypothetical protein